MGRSWVKPGNDNHRSLKQVLSVVSGFERSGNPDTGHAFRISIPLRSIQIPKQLHVLYSVFCSLLTVDW